MTEIPITNQPDAYVLIKGLDNGIVLPLVEELKKAGKDIKIYRGVVDMDECPRNITDDLSEHVVDDQGVPGKVLHVLARDIGVTGKTHMTFYNIGSLEFMEWAANFELNFTNPETIFIYKNETFSSLRSRNV